MGGRFRGWFRDVGLRAAAIVLLLSLASVVAVADDGARLVYANDGFWRSDLLVSHISASETATIRFSNCGFGPSGVNRSIPPDASLAVDDFGRWMCGDPIGIVPFETTNSPSVTVYVRRVADGITTTSYEIPPLTWALHAGDVGEVRLIRSNAEFDTALIVFNDGAGPARLTVRVYAEDGLLAGTEAIDLAPGLTFHMLTTLVDVGRLELEEETAFVSPPLEDQPVYGFAAVGVRGGGSQRILPFGPKLRWSAMPAGAEVSE